MCVCESCALPVTPPPLPPPSPPPHRPQTHKRTARTDRQPVFRRLCTHTLAPTPPHTYIHIHTGRCPASVQAHLRKHIVNLPFHTRDRIHQERRHAVRGLCVRVRAWVWAWRHADVGACVRMCLRGWVGRVGECARGKEWAGGWWLGCWVTGRVGGCKNQPAERTPGHLSRRSRVVVRSLAIRRGSASGRAHHHSSRQSEK